MALTQVPVSMVDFSVNPTLSGGTANGVAYLNGSKVVTTGSALTFDGTNLTTPSLITTTDASGLATFGRFSSGYTWSLIRPSTTATGIEFRTFTGDALYQLDQTSGSNKHIWYTAGSEQMRLTSTGLGIGTSSPVAKLDVKKTSNDTISRTNAVGGFGDWDSLGAGLLMQQTLSSPYGFALQAANAANSVQFPLLLNPSGGNVGIGTNSPVDKLEVYSTITARAASGTSALRLRNTTSDYQWQTVAGTNAINLYDNAVGSSRLTVDSSGNLGLGVTPSAWSGLKAFEIAGVGSSLASASNNNLFLSSNAWYNGTNWRYGTSAEATQYQSFAGAHKWYNAPSGTAGNAITFTQAMTLDASGRLLIGNTTNSNGEALQIDANGVGSTLYTALFRNTSTSTSVYNAVRFLQGASGSAVGYIGTGGSAVANAAFANNFVVGTQSSSALVFNTNDTERARITSGGEVYIAGTTDQGAYNLQVNGTGVWGAGAYVNGSDARLKEEVQDLAPALDVIASLRPVTFRYKEDYSKDQNVQPGFIAQELQTAMAGQAYVDGVIQSGPQHLNVAYQSLIPLLTKAIQELKAEFDAYKATHP
jgi:hypothetical protein